MKFWSDHLHIVLIHINLKGNIENLILVLVNHEKCVLTATYKYYRKM